MRTTLNIADDVLLAAKERARRERRSIGDVLSDLARQALTRSLLGEKQSDDAGQAESFHGFEPLPRRGPAVSNAFIDKLREDESI